jgi:transposase
MSFIFTEKKPILNREWVYVWLCESKRHNQKPSKDQREKNKWPKTKRVVIGRHYIEAEQIIYTDEFLDPKRTEIKGIPIPKEKQRQAVSFTASLKTKLGGKLLPGVKKQKNRRMRQNASNPEPSCRSESNADQAKNDEAKSEQANRDAPQVKSSEPLFTIAQVKHSTRKRFGAFYLCRQIADKIGLSPILMETFPGDWRELFTLACYLTTTEDPIHHCQRWLNKTEAFPASLPSSSINKLLSSLNCDDICRFYELWIDLGKETDYLALDISSVSSYPQLSTELGFGCGGEGNELPQMNMCLLFGKKSRLPYFLKTYNGELKDVGTLKTTLAEIFSLGGKNLTLVFGEGFASSENIDCLTAGAMKDHNFIMALPLAMDMAKQQPKKFIDAIKKPCDVMTFSDKTCSLTAKTVLNDSKELFTHVFYDLDEAVAKEHEKRAQIKKLLESTAENPLDEDNRNNFKKRLNIKRNNDGAVESIDVESIDAERSVLGEQSAYCGWPTMISNCADDAEQVLSVYRTKDVAEKAFHRLKGQLDMRPVGTHADKTMKSKVFVSFLSLVIIAYIDKVMSAEKLYEKFTLREVIDIMESLHVINIQSNRLLEPLTSEQKLIFDSFGIEKPYIFDIIASN